MYAAYDDLDHFASIQIHFVACLHVYGRFLESFLVAQYSHLVRFDLACRSDVRHSNNWPTLPICGIGNIPNSMSVLRIIFFVASRSQILRFWLS